MKEQSSSRATKKSEWLTHIEAVLEMLNEGIVITNEDQRILFVNSRFGEMTGIPQQDLLGADISEFYSEKEWEFLAQQIAVVRHQGRHRYEFLLPQKDGGRLPVIISSRILQNSGGEFRIITASDISEQARIAKELHDTLLQGFVGASMQLHVAADRLPDDSPAKPPVNHILELMGQVIEEGRNAVRGLRLTENGSNDLAEAFARVPQELGAGDEIDFRVIVAGQPRSLHPVLRDEVYRLGREALANAFRHSRAGRSSVSLASSTFLKR